MLIKEHQTFEATNLLVCEGTYYQHELNALIEKMKNIIAKNNAQRVGATISATLAVYEDSPKFDILIMIPLNKEIEVTDLGFRFEPIFTLTNAVTIRHIGAPSGLSIAAETITKYIMENNLEPVSMGYNMTIREASSESEINDMIVDIYIDIKKNNA